MKRLLFILTLFISGLSFSQDKNAEITQLTENSITSYSFHTGQNFPEREYLLICSRLKKEVPAIKSINVNSDTHVVTFVLNSSEQMDNAIQKITKRFRYTTYSLQ